MHVRAFIASSTRIPYALLLLNTAGCRSPQCSSIPHDTQFFWFHMFISPVVQFIIFLVQRSSSLFAICPAINGLMSNRLSLYPSMLRSKWFQHFFRPSITSPLANSVLNSTITYLLEDAIYENWSRLYNNHTKLFGRNKYNSLSWLEFTQTYNMIQS